MTGSGQSRPVSLRIGIVAALPGELAPLVQQGKGRGKSWERVGRVYRGELMLQEHCRAVVYACSEGMGAAAATQAFAQVTAAAGQLHAIVSYGWAGAISCGVKPPDFYQATEVIDARTGERFTTAALPGPGPLRLVTLDHVARSDEKRPLAERYQAVLVDMEAATIARLARAHGIPFLCAKAISDAYTDVLPDFNRFLSADGQLHLPAFVVHALLRPRYWAPIARLGINSQAAARNLSAQWAAQLPACLAEAGLLSCS